MDYTIDKVQLLADIKKEISHEAARQFSDEGTSLYDAIYPMLRDEETITDIIEDSLTTLIAQLRFARPSRTTGIIRFDLPDLSAENGNIAEGALSRYIVLESCREWFSRVNEDLATLYTPKRDAALSAVISLLYVRNKPTRP